MLPSPSTSRSVASSDGVAVAVHHVSPGPAGAPLLIAHATGFHGRAYAPLAAHLDGFDVWAHDARGHGATPAPAGWVANWPGYGDDTIAVARWLAGEQQMGGGLVGIGHSMGGATLLMAAHRHPGLFRALVLYEPIVVPPVGDDHDPDESPLVRGARRRRREFESYLEAIANFSSKPPMSRFAPEALEQYVYGGFRPVDPCDPDGPVELTCEPELEAATFAVGHESGLWAALPAITTPTLVVGGRLEPEDPPALMAEPIAEEMPNARYHAEPELDHFGPFVDPERVAGLVRAFAA